MIINQSCVVQAERQTSSTTLDAHPSNERRPYTAPLLTAIDSTPIASGIDSHLAEITNGIFGAAS